LGSLLPCCLGCGPASWHLYTVREAKAPFSRAFWPDDSPTVALAKKRPRLSSAGGASFPFRRLAFDWGGHQRDEHRYLAWAFERVTQSGLGRWRTLAPSREGFAVALLYLKRPGVTCEHSINSAGACSRRHPRFPTPMETPGPPHSGGPFPAPRRGEDVDEDRGPQSKGRQSKKRRTTAYYGWSRRAAIQKGRRRVEPCSTGQESRSGALIEPHTPGGRRTGLSRNEIVAPLGRNARKGPQDLAGGGLPPRPFLAGGPPAPAAGAPRPQSKTQWTKKSLAC